MPSDAELTFADHMGRFYARRYSFAPMVGRLLGYLAVCVIRPNRASVSLPRRYSPAGAPSRGRSRSRRRFMRSEGRGWPAIESTVSGSI